MKKAISLILAAVMLLGVMPVLAAEQTTAAIDGYTVSLGESIAIEFYAEAANLTGFEKLVFYKDGEKNAEVTQLPAAESNGRVYFKYDRLGPHQMDAEITAELYVTGSDEPADTKSCSVLDYCKYMITNSREEKLLKLVVDMLYYGAEAQTYMDNSTAVSNYIATLSDEVKALASAGDATVNALSTTVYEEITDPAVSFTKAALVLNAGIVPSFTFTTELDASNLIAEVKWAGKTWTTKDFTKNADGSYTFDFDGMNPSRVRSWIFVTVKDADGNPVSHTCMFTAEHYTAKAADAEKALTNAMMHYGDAVKAYVTRDITSGSLTDAEKAVLSALTPEQYKAAIADTSVKTAGIVNWAYSEANIDVSAHFDMTVFNLMKKLFEGSAGSRTLILSNSTSYAAKYGKLLVAGYYGGTEVSDADKLFTAADFHVGDVFCSVSYKDPTDYSSTKSYRAGVYLGDGKFLMSGNTRDSSSAEVNTELVFSDTLAEEVGIYFVLRPEQLSYPAEGGLSAETQAKLADLTVSDLEAAKKTNDTGAIKWFCQQAGMTSSDVNSFSSIVTISGSLFTKSGTWTLKEGEDTYHTLFVDGYYGGAKFGSSKTFTKYDFEIGDIFCAQDAADSNIRYVGMYQGDGKFLLHTYDSNKKTVTVTVDTVLAFGSVATTLNYYFVLRPAQYLNTPANS